MYAVIVANAPDFDAAPLIEHICRADLLVAADGGAQALQRVGRAPHVVIGDLDSLDSTMLDWLHAQGSALVRMPPEKNETDLELALLLAVERGAATLDILGALGGRIDHTFANLTMLTMEPLRGRQARMLAAEYEVFVVRAGEQRSVQGQHGDTVSLLPLSATASGVTIQGFYYPLNNDTLTAAQARGVSNVLLETSGCITLHDGMVLVVHHFDGGTHQWESYQ